MNLFAHKAAVRMVTAFAAVFFMAGYAMAQSIEIRGRVKDADRNKGFESVNIVVQKPDSTYVVGTVSGQDGRFVLGKLSAGDYRLVVSSVGYLTQRIELNGLNKNLHLHDITMEEMSVALGDVTVTASNTTTRSDRKLIYPSDAQRNISTNGVDLLMHLMLPRVVVNPVELTASLPGGGELQYRINGVKAEPQEIIALHPADIIRIEYHDNPGLRYGNAEVVLDYIVRRPQTGGNVGLHLRNGINSNSLGDYYLNGKINHRKSEFSLYYDMHRRNLRSMWRDNEETFTFADGSTLHRKEAGEPGHMQYIQQFVSARYSYQNDRRMLNATFRSYGNDMPHFDYKGVLYNMANPDDKVRVNDNTTEYTIRPALDLYYQENMKDGQTLVFNLVSTYNHTDNRRFYQESREGTVLTDINNEIVGKKYSWIGEGIYEKIFTGANRFSTGLRHSWSYSDNRYRNGHEYATEMTQSDSYLYAEFKGKYRKLDYTLGAGITRSYFEQQGEGYSNYSFNPRLVLHLTLPGQSSVRLRSELTNRTPSLSELSAVDQTLDSLQIQRGNPNLKPYLRYRTELNYDFRKGIVNLNFHGLHEYQPKAVMEEKFLEGDKIIQTWNNQRYAQMFRAILSLRLEPVKNTIFVNMRGGVNHYISDGKNYHHTYTNRFTNSELVGTYKNVSAYVGIETNIDSFFGETLRGGENIHFAGLQYKYKELSANLMMLNPFIDNYKQESENRSRYASFERKMYINETSRFLMLRLIWNFSFGRKFSSREKRLNNADDDSGVMNTGK